MAPNLHRRMRELFEEALRQPEGQRQSFIDAKCGGDRELAQAVARLLSARTKSEQFLSRRNETKRFGRYVASHEIGRGAMGIVYEAVDPLIGRRVALKALRIDSAGGPSVQFLTDRLFREAQSGGMLSHPGIVTVFDVGQEDGETFIAMELVEGQTLEDLLSANPHCERTKVLEILKQSAAALDYAHQRGIVHRDIKPANIMLDRNGIVKITDFGIASITLSPLQTATAVVMGTPTYMSPEQIQVRKVDRRSDQFSLAVVAFELFTGARPFQGDSLASLAHQIVYEEPPSASGINPQLPRAVDKALRRGLAKQAANRYNTCSELVSALDSALREAPRRPRSKRVFYLAGSGVAAAILLAGTIAYRYLSPPAGSHTRPPAARVEAPKVVPVPPTPPASVTAPPPKAAAPDAVRSGKQLYADAVEAEKTGQAKARALLEEAAKLGEVRAMVDLGEDLLFNKPPDSTRAEAWFRKAADKDDTGAMNLLGVLYQNPVDGKKGNFERAAYWYGKAAHAGNAQAMYNLANMLVSGVGVSMDLPKAKELLRRSAEAENLNAKVRLAELEGK
jgi:serine/threonine protein kinase